MNKAVTTLSKLFGNLNQIKGVSFVSIEYTNQDNEIQKSLINVGVSYAKAKEKDIDYLRGLDVSKINDNRVDSTLLEQAKNELLNALIKPNENRSKGQADAYTHLTNGMKIHNETNALYVYGYVVKKTVLVEGTKKADTRKPLTLAKDIIRKGMKSTQYRNYDLSNFGKITLKGDTLMFA